MAAAISRDPFEVQSLLTNAYKADLAAIAGVSEAEAAQIIADAEFIHWQSIITYGFALSQDNALELVAGGLAKMESRISAFHRVRKQPLSLWWRRGLLPP